MTTDQQPDQLILTAQEALQAICRALCQGQFPVNEIRRRQLASILEWATDAVDLADGQSHALEVPR